MLRGQAPGGGGGPPSMCKEEKDSQCLWTGLLLFPRARGELATPDGQAVPRMHWAQAVLTPAGIQGPGTGPLRGQQALEMPGQ
jgi:hypothetical protein